MKRNTAHARLLSAALALAGCAGGLLAQTSYDDFNGAAMSEQLWWAWGDVASTSLGQSKLHFALGADEETVFTARQHWRGDFDFVVDFDGVAATGPGQGSFYLTVFDAQDLPWQSSFIDLSIDAWTTGNAFSVVAERKQQPHGSGRVPTTASAGQLRIARAAGFVTTYYREGSTGAWKTMLVWPDFLTDIVALEISAWTDNTTALRVSSDKVAHRGGLQAAPTLYGRGCGGMRTTSWSLPYFGNSSFGSAVAGASALANAPLVLLLGAQRLSVDLTPAGAPGCTLLASPDLVLFATKLDAEAFAFVPLPLPNDPQLVGVGFFQQFMALTSQNALGLVFSNAIETRVTKL